MRQTLHHTRIKSSNVTLIAIVYLCHVQQQVFEYLMRSWFAEKTRRGVIVLHCTSKICGLDEKYYVNTKLQRTEPYYWKPVLLKLKKGSGS
jgi:hypothetical protein